MKNCYNCNKPISNRSKYCDNICQWNYQNSTNIKDWIDGKKMWFEKEELQFLRG